MAGLLDSVDQRTQLAGHNRLELLLFRLNGRQVYGINVFKVQEVIKCPKLTSMPDSHPVVRGVAHMRGKTISIMDLGAGIGLRPIQDLKEASVIVTEYNRKVQGFLVNSVDRIVNANWEEIFPPPKGSGAGSYLTAVTKVEGTLVEIIDVEKIMYEVCGQQVEVSDIVRERMRQTQGCERQILVVDDSSVARNQVVRTLEQMGYNSITASNGRIALDMLKQWADEGSVYDHISMIVSDVEMPEMDGYTLTRSLRADPRLKDLYVMLHTSLSGVFNNAMIEKVGANRFIPKFNADELANGIMEAVSEITGE